MKLSDYVAKLERGASNPLSVAIERVRKDGLRLIDDGFKTETGPYGESWPMVEPHKGHRSVLIDTGALRKAWDAFAVGNLIKFSNSLAYACRQNYGYLATGQPARRMIPDQRIGFGSKWSMMIKLAFVEVGKRVYGPK